MLEKATKAHIDNINYVKEKESIEIVKREKLLNNPDWRYLGQN